MRQITRQMLQIFTSPDSMDKADRLANMNRAIIISNKNDRIEAEVPDEENTYHVTVKQNEERYFDTSCSCDEHTHPLCVHKCTLFLQALKTYGAQYFSSTQNFDVQKNKLLEQYGYSLNDDLTNKFTFTYENNKPFLRVLDSSIKKVAVPASAAVAGTIEGFCDAFGVAKPGPVQLQLTPAVASVPLKASVPPAHTGVPTVAPGIAGAEGSVNVTEAIIFDGQPAALMLIEVYVPADKPVMMTCPEALAVRVTVVMTAPSV